VLLSHAAPKKTGAKPPQRKSKDPPGPAEQPQARKEACSLSFGERDRCDVKWSMPLARALAAPVAAAARMRTTKTQPEPVDAPEAPEGANRAWHGFPASGLRSGAWPLRAQHLPLLPQRRVAARRSPKPRSSARPRQRKVRCSRARACKAPHLRLINGACCSQRRFPLPALGRRARRVRA